MTQPSMRITVDAAMRARDISRPAPEGAAATPSVPADPPRRTRAAKNERRRLGKRGPRPAPQNPLTDDPSTGDQPPPEGAP
ncbi:hypothetical protein [Actinomadura gamaensis]|uniref:Uncharacterized protein n=1 Tax=Actinomadura gamaensis TaxID=1763541 RepID=A0ABV9U4R1_9ACTN